MRSYAGNGAASLWCFRKATEQRLGEQVVKVSGLPLDQLTRLYGAEAAALVLHQGPAWRGDARPRARAGRTAAAGRGRRARRGGRGGRARRGGRTWKQLGRDLVAILGRPGGRPPQCRGMRRGPRRRRCDPRPHGSVAATPSRRTDSAPRSCCDLDRPRGQPPPRRRFAPRGSLCRCDPRPPRRLAATTVHAASHPSLST
ncbi:DUF3556 domain-containing protein [Streptomyces sp. NPDC003480]